VSRYAVDRELLESYSTGEILRILKKERDDYTPEAIEVFKEILVERGAGVESGQRAAEALAWASAETGADAMSRSFSSDPLTIRTPSDARRVLNDVLRGLMDGNVPPETAQAACAVAMGILRSIELEYMSDAEEVSP
jgi:hypothetical protein